MLRRAATAGTTVAVLVAILGLVGVAALDGTGALGLVAVMVAATAGLVVASSWLLLSVLLDLLAGEWPGRRRLAWTVAVTLATFVAPAFLLAALTAAT